MNGLYHLITPHNQMPELEQMGYQDHSAINMNQSWRLQPK